MLIHTQCYHNMDVKEPESYFITLSAVFIARVSQTGVINPVN